MVERLQEKILYHLTGIEFMREFRFSSMSIV